MEPLPKKTLPPGTVEGQFKQLQWQQCHCRGTAMGTSRAGPGWTCWLSSAHSPQLAMGSLESFGQAIGDTVNEEKKTSVVTPEPKLSFLHTGKVLRSFGGRIMPSTWAQMKEHNSASSAMDPGQHAGPYRKGRSESEHRHQPINTFTMAKHPHHLCPKHDETLWPPALVQHVQAASNTLNIFSVEESLSFHVFSLNAPYKGWDVKLLSPNTNPTQEITLVLQKSSDSSR